MVCYRVYHNISILIGFDWLLVATALFHFQASCSPHPQKNMSIVQ